MTSPARVAAAPAARMSREQLIAALTAARARNTDAALVSLEIPAPSARAEALLDLDANDEASYWAEPSGREHAALGVVQALSASGPTRFRDVSREAQAVFASFAGENGGLRIFGGFAFQTERARSAEWAAFGEARFVVPRLCYERGLAGARFVLVLRRQELDDSRELDKQCALVLRALEALEAPRHDVPGTALEASIDTRSEPQFIALVESIRTAIARAELEKVVAARAVRLALSQRTPSSNVLARLASIAPECLRFGFRIGDRTFLGATPERLVSKHGRAFETEAVAGSLPAGTSAPARLMESSKDRAEQAIVVREVLHALEPIAQEIQHAAVPEIQSLRHVTHLRTKIRGQLREPLHVLDLVERLHPTPAVGGFPSARAQAFIATNEPAERGWYSGPIGWFDAKGDGAFAVALRSGLLSPQQALLYAGAGIVHGSDAESELSETRWKLQALFAALGVVP